MRESTCAVIGAGIMGLWSALSLLERGHAVLLLDAWGPGNSRATSADESRVIRCGYGGSIFYARWAARAQRLWAERERQWGETLFHRCGVLWMVAGDEPYAERCAKDLRALGEPFERLNRRAFAARYPQIRPRGIRWALLEPRAGLILARESCRTVARRIEQAGGDVRVGSVSAPEGGRAARRHLLEVRTDSGDRHRADQFLFACGPWMASLFPELLGRRIKVTRKEVFYFGTPAGDDSFLAGRMPVWMELGAKCYGVPAVDGKGFKVHPEMEGPRVDPTVMQRRPTTRLLKSARACLSRRFPALRDAPLLESRVCQYEATRDDHLIFDRHPDYDNVWILGGGSGHGFKHGPVIGEMAARAIGEGRPDSIPPELRLSHDPRGRNF